MYAYGKNIVEEWNTYDINLFIKKKSKSVRYEVRKDWGYDKQAKKKVEEWVPLMRESKWG